MDMCKVLHVTGQDLCELAQKTEHRRSFTTCYLQEASIVVAVASFMTLTELRRYRCSVFVEQAGRRYGQVLQGTVPIALTL